MKPKSIQQKVLSAMLSAAMVSSVGAVSCTALTAQAAAEEAPAVAAAPAISSVFSTTVGNFEYSIDVEKKQATLTKYNGSASSVTVPSTITRRSTGEAYSVVRIGAGAFMNNSSLTTLTLRKNLRYIDEKAFCGCHNLTSVNVFNQKSAAYQYDLVYIGKNAFQNCKLNSVYIPDSVVYIDSYAFDTTNDDSVVNGEVYIGDSVYSIGDNAFDYSASGRGITGIRLGDCLRYIGRKAFAGPKKMPGGSIFIPSTVTTIDMKAFIGSDGCGEKEQLLRDIADVSGGFDDVVAAAYRFASGDYVSYHLVSAENNKACEKYCSNDAMWDARNKTNRPDYVVSEKMKNIASVSRTGAYVGDSITFAVEAPQTSSTGQYCYKVILKNIDTGKSQSFTSQVSDQQVLYKKLTAKKAGIYNVTINSYQVEENGEQTIIGRVYRKLVVSEPLQNTSGIRNVTEKTDYTAEDLAENATMTGDLKTKYQFKTSSEGGVGEGSVSYSYVLKRKTGKKQVLYFDTNSAYRDDMGAAIYEQTSGDLNNKYISVNNTPGTYYLTIFARDAARRVVSSKTITFKVNMKVGQSFEARYRDLVVDQSEFDSSKNSDFSIYYLKTGVEGRVYLGKKTCKNAQQQSSKATFKPTEAGTYKIYIRRTQVQDGKTITVHDYYTFNVEDK